jgi:benzoyl-CoA reductase/2-hydroxyglutaryl-CoA dehydratase subunit BcrC/BadD/HgdB
MPEYKKIRVGYPPSAKKLKNIMAGYMLKASIANKLPWKKLAWATAGFPIELLWTYNVFPLHPENAACVAGVRRISQDMIEYAESLGFSRDLCSYMKTNIGAFDKKLPITSGGIDKPAFCASTNTICDTHVKWFQTQARKMKIPYFGFDIPSYVSGSDPERMEGYIDYVVDQIYKYFDFMQDITGKSFNFQRFKKILVKSDRLAELWHEIYELRKLTPVSYSFQETLSSIFPMVILPGLDDGIKFYEAILKDLKGMIARGEGSMPPGEEKYRLMWEGIPPWYKIKFLYEMANYGAIVVYEPYTFSFGPRKRTDLPEDQLVRELAKLMMHFPYNYNLETRIKYFENIVDEYKLDGVILHENMSCRPSCVGMIDLKNAIQRDKGIPVWILSSDMNDPRAWADEPMKNRLESFIELMEANKKK